MRSPAFDAAVQRINSEAIQLRDGRIEDYQYIRGDQLTARQAADRLGVSIRTIQRYRRSLGIPVMSTRQSVRRGGCARWHGTGCRCWQTGTTP